MADFTPTTEQVRDWFDTGYEGPSGPPDVAFDRWLAEVKASTLDFAADQIRVDETGEVAEWLRATANLYRANPSSFTA